MNKEYYDILGVSKGASNTDIKKSYRNLSRKYHPDKNRGKEKWASEKFKKVSEAYSVLSDPEKRKIYDQFGKEGLENGMNMNNDNGFPFPFPFGGHNHRRHQIPTTKLGIKITLEQAFKGGEFTHTFNRKKTCFTCLGHGTKDKKSSDCSNCDGKGIQVRVVRMGHMIQQTQSPCQACHGSGEKVKPDNKCKDCKGRGLVKEECTFKYTIIPGTINNLQMETEKGTKGHDLKPRAQKDFGGREFSELIVYAKVKSHPLFQVKNRFDLVFQKDIPVGVALTGTNFTIPGIDGENIVINKKDIIKDNTVYEIKGKGMPVLERLGGTRTMRGSLYVVFKYQYPETLTNTQKRVILETLYPGHIWKLFEENPDKADMKLINQNNNTSEDKEMSSSSSDSDSGSDEDIREKLKKQMNMDNDDMPGGVQCAQQ